MEKEQIVAKIKQYSHLSAAQLVEKLNDEGVPSMTGKKWTRSNAAHWKVKVAQKKFRTSSAKTDKTPKIEIYSGKTVRARKEKVKDVSLSSGTLTVIMGSVSDVTHILRGMI